MIHGGPLIPRLRTSAYVFRLLRMCQRIVVMRRITATRARRSSSTRFHPRDNNTMRDQAVVLEPFTLACAPTTSIAMLPLCQRRRLIRAKQSTRRRAVLEDREHASFEDKHCGLVSHRLPR